MKKKRTRRMPLCLAMLMPLAALAMICWSLFWDVTARCIRIDFKPISETSAHQESSGGTTDVSPMQNTFGEVSQDGFLEPLPRRHLARHPQPTRD